LGLVPSRRKKKYRGQAARRRPLAWVVLFTGLYILTSCPTVHWLDGGELSVSAFFLVPAHPPGEPFNAVLGRLATLIPLGSIAWRLNVLSALTAGAAVGAALLLWSELAKGGALDNEESRLLPMCALILAMGGFLTYPVWIQAVRTEVYAAHVFFALLTLGVLLRAFRLPEKRVRLVLLAGFFVGLDLAVHPLLAVLVALPAIPLVLSYPSGRRPRTLAGAACMLLMGFSLYVLLPIRAQAEPMHGWGHPSTLTALLDMLLARTFQRNFSPLTATQLAKNFHEILNVLLSSTGPLLLLLSLLGMVELGRRRMRGALLLLGVIATNFWAILPQNKVFADNPDLHGYLATTHILLWMMAALGLVSLLSMLNRWAPRARLSLAFVVPLLIVPPLVLWWPALNRAGDDLAWIHGTKALEGIPPGGYLIVSGNDATFILAFLQEVERRRPDVTVLSRSLLTHKWYRRRHGYSDDFARAARRSAARFATTTVQRPVRVEARAIDLGDAAELCPAPAPGWGFYDVRRCPDYLQGLDPEKREGLLENPASARGPHAYELGLQEGILLARYYEALHLKTLERAQRRYLVAKGLPPERRIPLPPSRRIPSPRPH